MYDYNRVYIVFPGSWRHQPDIAEFLHVEGLPVAFLSAPRRIFGPKNLQHLPKMAAVTFKRSSSVRCQVVFQVSIDVKIAPSAQYSISLKACVSYWIYGTHFGDHVLGIFDCLGDGSTVSKKRKHGRVTWPMGPLPSAAYPELRRICRFLVLKTQGIRVLIWA